ncbi:hypothetical protein HC891_20050 [Candidatus Gracilibacteria bacterium]|nr:hypothetical protein [Candidatus Gracilibacteria bacterium]
MSYRPPGSVTGIMGLFFREVGVFWEQAWTWAEREAEADRAESNRDVDRRNLEAQARLLEQIRLAKEAGIDVDAVLAQARGESRERTPPVAPDPPRR